MSGSAWWGDGHERARRANGAHAARRAEFIVSALGWLILLLAVLVAIAAVVVALRRRRRGGGVIATKTKP